MSAEYIMASGNEQVILCERGIRTSAITCGTPSIWQSMLTNFRTFR